MIAILALSSIIFQFGLYKWFLSSWINSSQYWDIDGKVQESVIFDDTSAIESQEQ